MVCDSNEYRALSCKYATEYNEYDDKCRHYSDIRKVKQKTEDSDD